MSLDRRTFLRSGLALLATGCASPGPSARWMDPHSDRAPFQHGVASGDPLADRVILWTRVSGAGPDPTPVAWRIARDPGLEDVVLAGRTPASTGRDGTVKVDAVGLEPATTYYYEFRARGHASPRGRTRTLPVGPTERVRLAFASCANLPQGYFNAYGGIARRADLDAVLHLGDYLYEYENGVYGDGRSLDRVPEPDREIVSLGDYRTRHAQYKRDPDLQELHRQHPVVAIWDDHEIANDSWRGGAQNHDPSEGDWEARRSAAVRAYLEWMPVREAFEAGRPRLQRSFRWGNLADLVMLDTRLYGRDAQLADAADPALRDSTRTLLGASQESWLASTLERSQREGVAWRALGQQVMLAPTRNEKGGLLNPDAWDGYPQARERLLAGLRDPGIRDLVVLTGDVHSSWAFEVAVDPWAAPGSVERAPVAVEFATPGISSPGWISDPTEAARRAEGFHARHPHLRWVDLSRQGYAILDLDRERAQAEWWFVETVKERSTAETFARAYRTRRGESRLERADAPAAPGPAPPLAP